MTPRQSQILHQAPRYLYCYDRTNNRKHLIPDTPKAQQWAIKQGATSFDSIPLYRFDLHRNPVRVPFGDCCLVVSSIRTPCMKEFIQRVNAMLLHLFADLKYVGDLSFVTAMYESAHGVYLTVPHAFFDIRHVNQSLPDFYATFAEVMERNAHHTLDDFKIQYASKVPAPNSVRPDGRYAVSLPWERFYEHAIGSDCAFTSPQPPVAPGQPPTIRWDARRHLQCTTQRRLSMNPASGGAAMATQWPRLLPLLGAHGVPACPPRFSVNALKCALSLAAWARLAGITEFQRRDALRAVDGTFHLEDGVRDGLAALVAHGYLQECPFPRYTYPGRRLSPWFVVNPVLPSIPEHQL